MISYKYKYLKYKQKYLEYKKKYLGGEINNENEIYKNIESNGIELLKNILNKNLVNNHCLFKQNNKYYIISTCNTQNTNIELTWNNYKKYLSETNKNWINQLRSDIINKLIIHIFNNFPDCKNNSCNFNISGSSGSDATLDSDYDLTLNGNYKISKIIQIFNSIFESGFGESSSIIFDTNLYGYSFLIPHNAISNNTKIWTCVVPNNTLYEINSNDIKSYKQDDWAVLRLISFYNNNISNILILDCNDLINYFKQTQNNINKLIPDHKQSHYVNKMSIFEDLMINNQDSKLHDNINNVKNEIIDSLSNMNYYGDETYFTQGAFIHVVGLMYLKNNNNKNKLFKKKYYLIHSMIENMAYFIHTFYKNKDIIYAIKYFNRFINACHKYNEVFRLNKYNLEELNNFTNFIKEKIRNRSNHEILSIPEYKNIIDINSIMINIKENLNNILNNTINNNNYIVNINHYYLIKLLILLNYYINDAQENTNIKLKYENNKFILSLKK